MNETQTNVAVPESSDDVRSSAPLQHVQTVTFREPLKLELDGVLSEVTVAYETYGRLNEKRDNAVLVCHALSGDSHVARHDASDAAGWWDLVVGPGKPIDTDRYFVICPNILGGCRGTTGPNQVNPLTGKRYAADFPAITMGDTVEVQRRLLDHLQVPSLRAVVGGSMGGQQAMAWAVRHPERVRGCILIATTARLSSQALAFDVVGRNAILHDPNYAGGHYYDRGHGPSVGLALARMLAHITYLSREGMTAKFDPGRLRPRDVPTAFEKKFSVGSYLAYQGDKFVERFDANSYVTLTLMMDLFDLGGTPEALRESMAGTSSRFLVMSFSSDWLFPPQQSREVVAALLANDKPVSYCEVSSPSGHDAFLLPDSLPTYGGLIAGFLANVDNVPRPAAKPAGQRKPRRGSIFQSGRLDHATILDLIEPGCSVLDLGCGTGELLSELRRRGHRRLVGVELDQSAIVHCVSRGLDVVHADLAQPLGYFHAGQFDIVVLSQALQCIENTEQILDEVVRVGRHAIVSFPNFAYRKLREVYVERGRSPKAPGLFGFEWYNTPNRRFASILDVQELCERKGIRVLRQVCLNTETGAVVDDDPNLNANEAIFVLSR